MGDAWLKAEPGAAPGLGAGPEGSRSWRGGSVTPPVSTEPFGTAVVRWIWNVSRFYLIVVEKKKNTFIYWLKKNGCSTRYFSVSDT